ncbi:hypothetical protein TEQG_07159 [Trichophyton equinum CBS 127.97]|uniref:Uncharacterized protein n=1 Tax=Trichophyton equinum (strain ATCC MYA-4606 / CBS 127.97) TaxID=559882 RepID=F2Q263_TRIEC|nr:hypothetical protein TEQG_07159 [Trichophyton equinum CBS 127.97]
MDAPGLQDWIEVSEAPFDYEDFNLSPTIFNTFCEEILQTNSVAKPQEPNGVAPLTQDRLIITGTIISKQYKLAELEEKTMDAIIDYMKKVEIWMKDIKEGLNILSEPPKSPVI